MNLLDSIGQMKTQLIFNKIMEISDDGFIVIDDNEKIIGINNTYCKYLGKNRDDIIGQNIYNIIKNSKLPEIMISNSIELSIPHKLEEGQSPTKEKYVIVSRASVSDKGKSFAAVGQVKFSQNTVHLAKILRNLDDELQYYKEELKRVVSSKYNENNIIGKDENFVKAFGLAKKVALNNFTVLLFGETGTGKEVFSNIIHYTSKRRGKPFIRINCAAIPKDLLESELFGYEGGSFTGAKKEGKKGKFELANGGTLFLDEIGDMQMYMQAKLLRVLQENEIERIGGNKTIPVDVRIIAATNKNLVEEIKNGKFREDLYYRLNVVNIKVPSLRERKKDIPAFVDYFVSDLNQKYGTNAFVNEEVSKILYNYDWPGNIRELRNIIYSAYNYSSGREIDLSAIPFYLSEKHSNIEISSDLQNKVNEYEKSIIKIFLKKNNYNCCKTAKELNIHRSTLYKKIEKYCISLR